jgi:two-component system LytT family response regulator
VSPHAPGTEEAQDARDTPKSTVLRVLLADDELLARRRLARLLAAIPDVALVAECVDAEQALARLRLGGVDVALLDIHMPGLSGIDVLAALGAEGGHEGTREGTGEAPLVVFCTAHQDHAIDAFEGGATDYLLKPIELARLQKAIERARARLRPLRERVATSANAASQASQAMQATQATQAPPGNVGPSRLAIETHQGILLLDPVRITHAVLEGALVTIVTLDGEHVTELSLQDLERRLSTLGDGRDGRFVRVHRRALLALEHVVRLDPIETGGLLAHTVRGHVVEVSRQAARALRRQLGV